LNGDMGYLLKQVGKKIQSEPEKLSPDELAEAAAWFEGRLDEKERTLFEEKAGRHPALIALLANGVVAHRQAEEQPVSMPKFLRDRVMEEVEKKRSSAIVQLIFDKAAGMVEQLAGPGGMEKLSPEPIRGARFDEFYKIQLQEVDIQVATDCRKDGRFDIWLKARPERSEVRRCEWQIWQDQKMLEYQMNDTGEGVFTGFVPGRYQCILQISGREVGQIDLSLKENGNG
jgi:hypothetical protein